MWWPFEPAKRGQSKFVASEATSPVLFLPRLLCCRPGRSLSLPNLFVIFGCLRLCLGCGCLFLWCCPSRAFGKHQPNLSSCQHPNLSFSSPFFLSPATLLHADIRSRIPSRTFSLVPRGHLGSGRPRDTGGCFYITRMWSSCQTFPTATVHTSPTRPGVVHSAAKSIKACMRRRSSARASAEDVAVIFFSHRLFLLVFPVHGDLACLTQKSASLRQAQSQSSQNHRQISDPSPSPDVGSSSLVFNSPVS